MPYHRVIRENGIRNPDLIEPGQEVRVRGRWIVPGRIRDGLILNSAEPKLYWFVDSRLVGVFPVGVGVRGWETPAGSYFVANRRANPVWFVPKSIQAEMEEEGKEVVERVDAGPDNPLGRYWIGLSVGGYGLHGTNAPSSVGQFSSHGCIRLHPDNIERLYHELPDSARVEIVYEPVKVACFPITEEVYLEVHSDHYRQWRGERLALVRRLITELGCDGLVDWDVVEAVVREAEGLAVRVSRPYPGLAEDPYAPVIPEPSEVVGAEPGQEPVAVTPEPDPAPVAFPPGGP